MNPCSRIPVTLSRRGHILAPLRSIAKFSWLLILAALIAVSAHAVDAQVTPITSVRQSISFTLPDFDGDQLFDLAFVQEGRSEFPLTDYWVHLRMSAAGADVVRVVGPTGGLQIASRDVNSDGLPDLILTSTWRNKPVAVLLNGGHGRFSSIDPSVYPEAFSASSTNWTFSAFPEYRVVVPSESRSSACPAAIRLSVVLNSSRRAARRSDDGCFLNRNLASSLGRAPPSDLPLL